MNIIRFLSERFITTKGPASVRRTYELVYVGNNGGSHLRIDFKVYLAIRADMIVTRS